MAAPGLPKWVIEPLPAGTFVLTPTAPTSQGSTGRLIPPPTPTGELQKVTQRGRKGEEQHWVERRMDTSKR